MSPIISTRASVSAGAYGWGGAVAAGIVSFESIATATATGSQTTLTFNSIPGTFKHLQIRGIADDTVGYEVGLQFNSDTAGNYTRHRMTGGGATTTSSGNTGMGRIDIIFDMANGAGTTFAVAITDILDYTSTTKNKTVRSFSGFDKNGSGDVSIMSGVWLSTSAITRIDIVNGGPINFRSGTTFALYGIKESA